MHSSPLSLIKKHHPLIRLFAAGGQTLGETADVQLQLMAIGIEEIVRGTFATVQLPDRHAGSLKAGGECYEGNHLILPGREGNKRESAGLLASPCLGI